MRDSRLGAEAGFGAPGKRGHPDPTDLGDAEAEGGGLGVGLAGVNHHQTLVLSERQVPSCGDMADAKRLAPTQVAPTPAVEGEGKGVRGSPQSSYAHHGFSPNLLKPQALFQGAPNLPHLFLRTLSPRSGTLILSQAPTDSSGLPRCL